MCLSKCIFIICFGYVVSITTAGNITGNTISPTSNTRNATGIDENVVLDYIFNNQSDTKEEGQDTLDFSTMDIETIKKIYEKANIRTNNETKSIKSIARTLKKSDEANHDVPFFINKAIDLMEQSVYSTRYRLQDSKSVRKRYANDPCYNLAIHYGSLMQLRIKLDNVYNTLMKLKYNVKFLWYLILYERCLTINVDVSLMVKEMFRMKGVLTDTIGLENMNE